jgi:hypothetical protein
MHGLDQGSNRMAASGDRSRRSIDRRYPSIQCERTICFGSLWDNDRSGVLAQGNRRAECTRIRSHQEPCGAMSGISSASDCRAHGLECMADGGCRAASRFLGSDGARTGCRHDGHATAKDNWSNKWTFRCGSVRPAGSRTSRQPGRSN